MLYFFKSKRYLLVGLFLLYVLNIQANNVRIRGDVRVLSHLISNPGNVAPIQFTVEWDNSWRDMFNYDAVYVFLKYKINAPGEEWHHLYLMDEGNSVTSDRYTLELVKNSGGINKNEGFYLYRSPSFQGAGTASVDVNLSWLINSNPDKELKISDFEEGKVMMVAMAIEMVYVPRGAFRAGDTYSANHFRKKYLPMPEKYDLISPASKVRTSSPVTPTYPDPMFAANRVNDISAVKNPATNQPTNTWYGDKVGSSDGYQFWAVQFDRTIRMKYLAIESVPGYVPTKWYFQGRTGMDINKWDTLYIGNGQEWETSLTRTYPPTRAFRVNPQNKGYIEYRILVPSQNDMPNGMSGNPPLIKNVSMTDRDLAELVDQSVMINAPATVMGGQSGLEAEDGDTWSGTTDVNYPNGYPAFYAMKYEISQEQYVTFLNKLRPEQQRNRTIGGALENLKINQFVFGRDKNKPSCRNGIRLVKYSENNEPMVFDVATTADCGPTLACNYLSPSDMLAYADWTGLRPMTEMEYEKMCRPFFPAEAVRGEYPWNSKSLQKVETLVTAGERTEHPAKGGDNVNFGAVLEGPVRNGAFAYSAASRQEMGASFWGAMEMGGNLAEICYNANAEGRKFRGIANNLHGNGKLNYTGYSDILAIYWPIQHNAFCLKGGHWADTDPAMLAISDRSRHWSVYPDQNIERRDSTVTFRLAHTAQQNTFPAYLTLENGQSTETGAAADTVCHGSTYTIRGSLPAELKEDLFSIAWFVSENKGRSWDLMEGEGNQSLVVTKLWNINTNEDVTHEYWFKKEIYGLSGDAKTDKVILYVLNDTTYMESHTDTLDVYDHSLGIEVKVSQAADFHWVFNGKDRNVPHVIRAGKEQVGAPYYKDLEPGNQWYIIRSVFQNHCVAIDSIRTYVRLKPAERLSDVVQCGEIMIDARDQKRYRTVKIGNQCWMADNLNYYVLDSRCYQDLPANCDVYGRLYNWKQAVGVWSADLLQGVCPAGWHIPNDVEWATLQGKSVQELRSQLNLWKFSSKAALANNNTRFSALPSGGYFFSYSTVYGSDQLGVRNGYFDLGTKGWWWTSGYAAAKWVNNASAFATIEIPKYATLDFSNQKVVSTSGTNSVFYNATRPEYLGNSTAIDASSKYNAQIAVQNNFYFGVRCVQDVK